MRTPARILLFLMLTITVACGSSSSKNEEDDHASENTAEQDESSSDSEDSSDSGPMAGIKSELQKGQRDGSKSFDHSDYADLLDSVVHYDKGRVDYKTLKDKEAELEAYLSDIADVELETLTKSSQLALLINAYNAYTLKLILKHYPEIDSIKNIERPWKQQNWDVGGHTLSLDQIEHRLIRPIYSDPRIHFAVNCAAIGCPPLAPFAYSADKLDQQLSKATERTLQDESYVNVDDGKLSVVKIFLWYKNDFVSEDYSPSASSVPAFITKYANSEVKNFIESKSGEPTVDYLDYDWSLNDTK